ncbi:MAG: OB-fold nucleic acid binding domain-containing protein [Nanoarchaeota archaeon]
MQENRQTAYKIWIADIIRGTYVQPQTEGEFGHLIFHDRKINRVNILAPVINVDVRENVSTITLDDGSATMQVRAFKEDAGMLQGLQVGDLVMVLGMVREYLSTIYITPYVVKKLENAAWMTVRKLELKKLYGEQAQAVEAQQTQPQTITQSSSLQLQEIQPIQNKQQVSETIAKPNTQTNPRQKLLQEVIASGDEGINVDVLIAKTQLPEQQAEDIITELLKEGEIYMPRPGMIKIV